MTEKESFEIKKKEVTKLIEDGKIEEAIEMLKNMRADHKIPFMEFLEFAESLLPYLKKEMN